MAYKSDEKPQKGDAVLGTYQGAPARGKVVAYDEKKDLLRLERRGPAQDFKMPGGKRVEKVQGDLEHFDAPAADFELIYRKGE